MNFINKLPIIKKILLLLLLPVVGALYLSVQKATENIIEVSAVTSLETLASFASTTNSLVHELQKERGLTGMYLGSKGQKGTDLLAEQRLLTDTKYKLYKKFIRSFDAEDYGSEFVESFELANGKLEMLAGKRLSIDAQTIQIGDALGYFTGQNAQLLELGSNLPAISANPVVTAAAQTLSYFLLSKERAGVERALVTGVFASNKWSADRYTRFMALMTQQNTYIDVAKKTASKDALAVFKEKLSSNVPTIKAVDDLRRVALKNSNQALTTVDSADWYNATTARINLMKEVEEILTAEMLEQSQTLSDDAIQGLIVTLLMMLAAFAVTAILAVIITRNITNPVNLVLERMRDMAEGEGDLTQRVEINTQDEIGDLGQAINAFIDKIHDVISEAQQRSGALAIATPEVNSASESLTVGASRAAESILETSATMEQMKSTVSQNAENAKRTEDIAINAAQQARDSGQAVSETVVAMKKIAERIAVIEEIAYQTNMLALNAAIEAARAGQHGQGFAVVAGEVRELARNSEKAAGEISTLVSSSVSVAEKAGLLLNEMVPSIEQTSELVMEISASSVEQSSGINEVSLSMGQLDTVSKENSALSSQLSVTATKLNEEAAGLEAMMGFFKVNTTVSHQSSSQSPAALRVVDGSIDSNALVEGGFKRQSV